MAKTIGKRELRKHLQGLTQEQLINHLLHLGDSFKDVQAYLQNVVHPADDETVRARYRQIIENEFFPARRHGRVRLAVARKAVTDYAKVAASVEGPADLMLAYVELGVRFTRTHADMAEPFYRSMERMYGDALRWIVRHGLEDAFRTRAEALLTATRGMGYWFHDMLVHRFADIIEGEERTGIRTGDGPHPGRSRASSAPVHGGHFHPVP
jgi:hypothetical protein